MSHINLMKGRKLQRYIRLGIFEVPIILGILVKGCGLRW